MSIRTIWLTLLLPACSDYNLQGGTGNNLGNGSDDDGPIVAAGDQPDIELTPATLDFGWLPAGCDPSLKTVEVKNVGLATLSVSDIRIAGENASEFLVEATPENLEPGESFTFNVGFAPTDIDEYTAQVVVASNDPDEAQASIPSKGVGSEQAVVEESFVQLFPDPVDVLWVVDNSGSMSEEVARLHNSFHVFMEAFTAIGLDYQIGVVSTDMDAATQSGRLQGSPKFITPEAPAPIEMFVANSSLGASGSGDEKSLDASKAALTDPLISAENDGFLREDANLAVIALSDENDYSGIGTASYISWLNGFKPSPEKTSFSAIVGRKGANFFDIEACGFEGMLAGSSAETANRYHEVIEATGGAWGDICELDFDAIVEYLSYTAAGLIQDYVLEATPTSIGGVVVTVDGRTISYNGINGWTWDSARGAVVFHGDAMPQPGDEVRIRYTIATECP